MRIMIIAILFFSSMCFAQDCNFNPWDDDPNIDRGINLISDDGETIVIEIYVIPGNIGEEEWEYPLNIGYIQYTLEWETEDFSPAWSVIPVCIENLCPIEITYVADMVEPCGYQGPIHFCDPQFNMQCRERMTLEFIEWSEDNFLVEEGVYYPICQVTFERLWDEDVYFKINPANHDAQERFTFFSTIPRFQPFECCYSFECQVSPITTPPCLVGDCNGDGIVSYDDIAAWFPWIGTDHCEADCNQDGIVNFEDIPILADMLQT